MTIASSYLYDTADPAAERARARDDVWFAANPRRTWRVRPLFDGESPLAEGMRAQGYRAYAIVIDHARNGDRRARFGRGVYPVLIREDDKHEARWRLSQEAARWAKWFRKSSATPPPSRGTGVVV